MPLSIGLVGLPNVGKSTLFNALIKKQLARAENRPFTTIEPNIGVVDVPDGRLLRLHAIITNPKSRPVRQAGEIREFSDGKLQRSESGTEERNPKQIQNSNALNPKIIPTTLKVIDIAGLVKDAHQGVGLGNQFLAHIREVDLIVYVVRAFEDPGVIHVGNRIDPREDLEILKLELELADIDQKASLSSRSPLEIPPSREFSPAMGGVEMTNRLVDKPYLVVVNVSESQLHKSPQILGLPNDVLIICAKTEAELVELPEDEQKEYLKSLGLNSSGLDRLIQKSYQRLGLITFFTAGEKEIRAWTVRQGATAPEAAAKIHTDMQRGFIAADIIPWQKLIEAGGWKQAKEKGWVRLEGKDYLVQDGDVMIVQFNV